MRLFISFALTMPMWKNSIKSIDIKLALTLPGFNCREDVRAFNYMRRFVVYCKCAGEKEKILWENPILKRYHFCNIPVILVTQAFNNVRL